MSPAVAALILFCGACVAGITFAGWLLRPLRPRPIPAAHCSVSRSRMWNAPELHPNGPWYYRPDGTIGDLRADMASRLIPPPQDAAPMPQLPSGSMGGRPPQPNPQMTFGEMMDALTLHAIVATARQQAIERRRAAEKQAATKPMPEPADLTADQQDTARRMIEEALGDG